MMKQLRALLSKALSLRLAPRGKPGVGARPGATRAGRLTGSPIMNLSREQFREWLMDALEDPATARLAARKLFLPAFPVAGGTGSTVTTPGGTVGYLPYFDGTSDIANSIMFEDTANSRIGIGTTSPGAALDIEGSNAGLKLGGSGTHEVTVTGATSGRLGQDAVGPFFTSDTNGAPLRFATNNGSGHEWMRITSAGNVGIGTTTPAAALDVVGGVNASGSVVIGGTATKQVSGGPELISFQNPAFNHVAFACFVGSEANFRFAASLHGFMEWGAGGNSDQDVAFFRNWAGGLAAQSFNGTTSDHAFAVQKPTTDGSVGADLFRVDTTANVVALFGKLGVNLSSPNFVLHTSGDAVALGAPNSAPTDANLNDSNISFWLDETNNNLKVRVKYSNGTLKTATITLT